MIRVFIVDDHALVRAGIRRMLEGMASNIEVVGESDSGRDALEAIPDLGIDMLLTDLAMPDMDGIALIKKARKKVPGLRCLVLSMHKGQEYVVAALRAGASGYVHKNASAEDLLVAVQAVNKGATFLHPAVAGSVVDLLREPGSISDPLDLLTDRQREILKLIAEGDSTKEIATRLHVSAKTVETHRAQLMERLQIRNVPGLVKFAVRHGLVDLD